MSQSNERALVVFPGALGDFVCFLPALIALSDRYGELVLAARSDWSCLLRHPRIRPWSLDHPAIRALYASSFDALTWRDRHGHFDAIYSWSGFGLDTFERNAQSLAARTVVLCPPRGFRSGEHARDYFARCVGSPIPNHSRLLPYLHLEVPRDVEKLLLGRTPWLVVHPGSGAEKKNWRGFPVLVHAWKQRTRGQVLAVLGPAEIERGTPTGNADLVLRTLTLPELAGVLRAAPLYLGNDSGVSHLAALLDTPGVVVIGPHTPIVHWQPLAPRLRCLWAPEFCRQCSQDVFCEHMLPAEQVLRALEGAMVTRSRP